MAEFAVWAPHAKEVQLVLQDVHRPIHMCPEEGWWHIDAPADEDTRYGFSVDGGPPMPDPRSCCQPGGVHELSHVINHRAFRWHDDAWKGVDLPTSVIYEMHVGTFTPAGTFVSAIERLDHLIELGVGAIELMPLAEFPGDRGWGYDGVSMYAPHHVYGGPSGLKQLVDACHRRGIGVIFDVVYNHLGPDGNYLSAYGPYFTDRHITPWGAGMNFDGEDAVGVREFVLGNVELWLECYHGDGLRLDAIHAIQDDSPSHIVADIVALAHRVGDHRGYPAWVTAENEHNEPTDVRDVKDGGWGLDAQWSDDFHHAIHALVTGERGGYYVDYGEVEHLARAIRDSYVFTGQYSKFFKRNEGAPATGISPEHFVVFAQNHDQIGNRARGERLSQLVDSRLVEVIAAVTILGPFVPLIFQGEEWGARTPFLYFTDHTDLELAMAVTKGRKSEFANAGWDQGDIADPQALSSFENSKLDWAEKDKPDNALLFDWYKTLIHLRNTVTDFTSPDQIVEVDGSVLIMHRGKHRVVANFGDEVRTVEGHIRVEPLSVRIISEGGH